jgi:putative hydrolase of the HAD superfamily
MNRLVVFDLDDTLYLERDYVRTGFRAVGEFVRRELGVRGFFAAAWRRFVAGERLLIFDRVLEERGVKAGPRLVRKLLSVYRTHAPKIRLCPDARRFLDRPPDGVAIGVITDGRVRSQGEKIRALGLDRFGDAIVITGRWGKRYAKPHPRVFLQLQQKSGLPGSACVYVGDNPAKDFKGPRALGWTVWRLRRPGGLHAGIPSSDVPEIQSCDELKRWMTQESGVLRPVPVRSPGVVLSPGS